MLKCIKIVILLLPIACFGQNEIYDSLKKVLKSAKHDSIRLKTLAALAEAAPEEEWQNYVKKINDLTITHLTNKNKVDEKLYLKYQGIYLNYRGYINQLQGNLDSAMYYFEKCLKVRESLNEKNEIAQTLLNMGVVRDGQSRTEEAIVFYNKSLKEAESNNNKRGIANALSAIGLDYYMQANTGKALEYYYKSLKMAEEIQNYEVLIDVLLNIAAVHLNQGDYDKTKEIYLKTLEYEKKINDLVGMAATYNSLGNVTRFKSKGNDSVAVLYFKEAIKLHEMTGNKHGMAISIGNLGSVFQNQKKYKEALELYEKGLKINKEIDSKRGIGSALFNIGTVYSSQNKYAEALIYYKESMAISQELKVPEMIRNAASGLSKAYKNTGEFAKALATTELYILMRDSINNQENKKVTIQSQLKYEYNKKAAADSIKVAEEKKLTDVKFKQEQNQRYFLYGGLGLTLLFGGFMFNRFRVTKKQKTIIEDQKLIVENQKHLVEEKQKEILDSIHYAKRIQQSLLPSEKYIERNLKNKE